MAISAFWATDLPSDENFFHRSLNVWGLMEDLDSGGVRSADLLKHQFLPLIGKTTSLAFIICRALVFCRSRDGEIEREEPFDPKQDANRILSGAIRWIRNGEIRRKRRRRRRRTSYNNQKMRRQGRESDSGVDDGASTRKIARRTLCPDELTKTTAFKLLRFEYRRTIITENKPCAMQ